VVAELHGWGFWCGGGQVFEVLYALDEAVSATVGDPFVVGDPVAGTVGLATPSGRLVDVLPVPAGGFEWGARSDENLGYTGRAVLRACAPPLFTSASGLASAPSGAAHPRAESRVARFADLLAGMIDLALNVRAVQDWVLAATDDTALAVEGDEAIATAALGRVDGGAVRRAAEELRAMPGVGRSPGSRPRLRTVRGADRGPGLTP
jgi:hypothetical protein